MDISVKRLLETPWQGMPAAPRGGSSNGAQPHALASIADDTQTPPGEPPARRTPAPPSMYSAAEFALAVDRALADCRRRRIRLAVLMLSVMDVGLSDDAGDIVREATPKVEEEALDKLALRLQRLVRATDQVVRIDSRNFGLVLSASAASEACLVDGRAQRLLAGPYSVSDQTLAVRLSVGRATYPENGVIGRELVRAASRVPLSLA